MRVRTATLTILIVLGFAAGPAVRAHAAGVKLTLVPTVGPPTTKDVVNGSGFPASDSITVTFDATAVATKTTNAAGKFSVSFVVPATAVPGPHTVTAFDPAGLGGSASFFVHTDWNSARFDPGASGFNPYENVLAPSNVSGLSQKAAPQWGAFLHSEAIVLYVAGDPDNPLVIGGSSDGSVRAFDSVGRQLWSFNTDGAVLGSPLGVRRTKPPSICAVVAGSRDGSVYGLDPRTGTQLWRFATGSAISTSPIDPTAVEDVFVSTDGGSAYDINGCTGSVIWSDVAMGPGPASTPAMLSKVTLAGGSTHTIIVVCLGDGAYALDAATGLRLWRDPGPTQTPAAYGSGRKARIVLGEGSSVVELNASTGHQVWSRATGGMVSGLGLSETSSETATGGLKISLRSVIAGDQAGDLYSLNPMTGALDWSDLGGGSINPGGGSISSPAIADGIVYFTEGPGAIPGAQTDGMLVALNAGSGALLFAADTGDLNPQPFPPAPPTIADGKVFVGDSTGGLRIYGLP
jgi:outer membrane protein assembly factor BamB